MLPTSTSKPAVIIFERHWDEVPKQIVKDLIPELAKEGYDTLCVDAPQNWSEEEILSSHQSGLELDKDINSQAKQYLEKAGINNNQLSDMGYTKLAALMRLFVSSQRYYEVAEKIKGLPASLLYKDIFKEAKQHSITLKGVDIDAADYHKMVSVDVFKRMRVIEKNESNRISTFSKNLFKLQREGKNLIFICGAFHAEKLLQKFREQDNEESVIYYFPHSEKNYDDGFDDVKEVHSNETLKNHTYRIMNAPERKSLVDRVLKDIKSKNTRPTPEIMRRHLKPRTWIPHDSFQRSIPAILRPIYSIGAFLNCCRRKK
jgi:hypothetical protein